MENPQVDNLSSMTLAQQAPSNLYIPSPGIRPQDTGINFRSEQYVDTNKEDQLPSSTTRSGSAGKSSSAAVAKGSRAPLDVLTNDELNRILGKRAPDRPTNAETTRREALRAKIEGSGQSLFALDKNVDASTGKRITRAALASTRTVSRAGSPFSQQEGGTSRAGSSAGVFFFPSYSGRTVAR